MKYLIIGYAGVGLCFGALGFWADRENYNLWGNIFMSLICFLFWPVVLGYHLARIEKNVMNYCLWTREAKAEYRTTCNAGFSGPIPPGNEDSFLYCPFCRGRIVWVPGEDKENE